MIGGGALAVAGAGGAYAAFHGMGSLDEYEASVAVTRAALRQTPEIREFVRFATLAASGHNTQPWTFHVRANRIDILSDFSRRTPVVDPNDHHLYVSLGCAGENLALAAGGRERPDELRFDPASDGAVVFALTSGKAKISALSDALPARQSSRTDCDGKLISGAALQKLAAAAAIPGVDLILITDRPQIDRIRNIVTAGNSTQVADRAFVNELKTWLRFNLRQAIEMGDGLFSASSGHPTLPAWLGPHVFDWVFRTGPENDKCAQQIARSPGIAVFVGQKDDREHWVLAGRACQRFALQATAMGMKHAFINQRVEVPSLRPELAALLGMPGRRPDTVTRFGFGPALPYSARRTVDAALA